MSGLLKSLVPLLRRANPYYKYGLLYDDLIVETPPVQETLRRLPPSVLADRDRRFKMAFEASFKHVYLPEHLWTKPEQDVSYLEPTLSEVLEEIKARKDYRA